MIMKMSDNTIELARILPISEVNGPGMRAVIWVQGCRKRCLGCWNPEYLKFGSDWKLSPKELVERVKNETGNFSMIEGVTFSGGEPFGQAENLSVAAKLFKDENLSVMSYSGYTLAEIQLMGPRAASFLDQLDILIDGEYIQAQHGDRLWRSSLNQQVHFLTDRYRSFENDISGEIREFEVTISGEESKITGFPESSFLRSFTQD
jgi:anaerobic ribonucleoside-triphosphate reductase activating protein